MTDINIETEMEKLTKYIYELKELMDEPDLESREYYRNIWKNTLLTFDAVMGPITKYAEKLADKPSDTTHWIKIDGIRESCMCGCKLFHYHHFLDEIHVCNACGRWYTEVGEYEIYS